MNKLEVSAFDPKQTLGRRLTSIKATERPTSYHAAQSMEVCADMLIAYVKADRIIEQERWAGPLKLARQQARSAVERGRADWVEIRDDQGKRVFYYSQMRDA